MKTDGEEVIVMAFKSLNVEMTSEHFDRSIKGQPRDAINELIWNACDADAKNIEVYYKYEGFQGAEQVSDIFVKDDGHGIPFDKVDEYFGKYGRSQKTDSQKSPGGRVYHGKLGQGRYKSFALGSFVDWYTVFKAEDGSLQSYEIRLNYGSRMGVEISESTVRAKEDHTGTVVHIHGIQDEHISAICKMAEPSEAVPDLLATFAPYLLAYKEVKIKYQNVLLDPQKQIETQLEKELVYQRENEPDIHAKVLGIKWKQSRFSKLYICGESGVVYDEQNYAFLQHGSLSVYLLSEHYEKLHQQNLLQMGLADKAYAYFDAEAKQFAKDFLLRKDAEDAAAEISRIKGEGAYPYHEEPADDVAKAERNVFDVLAVEVNRSVPQLRNANRETKKLTYRLMREAINTNPGSIKVILTEVFNLTQEQQDELAELLEHTHLPQIIDVAKTVSDRLTFIYLLEQMVYNDSVGKPIKERTQFHRILLKELWVFGEKYYLGTSDQSLKNLLRAHIQLLGRDELQPPIPEEAAEDLTRIPDLCLFSQTYPAYERYEHLVIELKRPTLTLTLKELQQIQDYALTVAENPQFDKNRTKWHFILLGQDFNSQVEKILENQVVGDGNYYNAGNVSVSVLRWATIIQNNKLKYEFLKGKLNHQLSDDPDFAMDYLMKKHSELFPEKEGD